MANGGGKWEAAKRDFLLGSKSEHNIVGTDRTKLYRAPLMVGPRLLAFPSRG